MKVAAVFSILALPAPALAQTVFVENATGAPDLISILQEEMPRAAFVETATVADLRAHLSEALRLVIADRNGITMLDRALDGGRDAAVRVAALLIVEARETWRPATPAAVEATVTTTVAAREWYVGASGGVGFGMWISGASAQLAFAGSAYFGIYDFELGATFSIAGEGCACSVRTESLRVEPRALAVVGVLRWIFWRIEWLETSVWIGLGYQSERVRSQVIAFPSKAQGAEETKVYGGPIGRIGISAGTRLFDRLRIRADAGIQVQRAVTITLPEELLAEFSELDGSEVERGAVVPWGALSIGLEL